MPCTTSLLRRLTVWITVGAGIAAVLIGRNARVPKPRTDFHPEVRTHTSPRYRAYDGFWFPTNRHAPRLLDVETGVVLTFPLSAAERFDSLSCSPWQDGAGRFHLVGRSLIRSGPDPEAVPITLGLARCTFPGGEVLDHIPLDPLPTANPCWYPDGSGRVLFASGGRLYQVAFPGKTGAKDAGLVDAGQPQPVAWRTAQPGRRIEFLQDLHWPSDGSLSLDCALLASLSLWQRGTSSYELGKHLWWLDLGREGIEIVAAGRLISSDPTGALATRAEERHPVVSTSSEGTSMLAYLAREEGRASWDLWVVPIARGRVDSVPYGVTSAGHKLAGDCEPVVPAFSADRRWVYAIRHSLGQGPRLERFAVAKGQAFETLGDERTRVMTDVSHRSTSTKSARPRDRERG